MASKLTGVAVIFGFRGDIDFSGVGTFIKESGDFEHDVQIDELTDDDNELVTLAHSKESITGTLLFTPRSAKSGTAGIQQSLASAKASLARPDKGAAVALSNFDLAELNTLAWVYVGGWKLAFTKKGMATYSLKIRSSPNNDLSLGVA